MNKKQNVEKMSMDLMHLASRIDALQAELIHQKIIENIDFLMYSTLVKAYAAGLEEIIGIQNHIIQNTKKPFWKKK